MIIQYWFFFLLPRYLLNVFVEVLFYSCRQRGYFCFCPSTSIRTVALATAHRKPVHKWWILPVECHGMPVLFEHHTAMPLRFHTRLFHPIFFTPDARVYPLQSPETHQRYRRLLLLPWGTKNDYDNDVSHYQQYITDRKLLKRNLNIMESR